MNESISGPDNGLGSELGSELGNELANETTGEAGSAMSPQDERILAALAHISVMLPVWGMIGTIILWVTQREKSQFVGFQALQALVYQLTLVVGGILAGGCYMCLFAGTGLLFPLGTFATLGSGGSESGGVIPLLISLFGGFLPFCLVGVILLIAVVFVLYALYGAVRVLQGEDFRYAIIGRKLEEYLAR